MKKILLISGHTSGYNSCRATGVNEGDLNIELVNMIKPMLEDYAKVTLYPHTRDAYKDNLNGTLKVNLRDYDYILEVHFNAGGGRGTSIQLHGSYSGGISVEQAIINNIAAIGFRKRGNGGIVRRNDLLNMNTALAAGVDYALLETCFYDNTEDMTLYKVNKLKVAKAIADGMIEAFGLTLGSSASRRGTVANCSVLNVRKAPNGAVIGTIKRGTKVSIIGIGRDSDGDSWHMINVDGLTGYVWPKYIDF